MSKDKMYKPNMCTVQNVQFQMYKLSFFDYVLIKDSQIEI